MENNATLPGYAYEIRLKPEQNNIPEMPISSEIVLKHLTCFKWFSITRQFSILTIYLNTRPYISSLCSLWVRCVLNDLHKKTKRIANYNKCL